MWTLHNLATAYGQRPSEVLGLEPRSWTAYQVDLATLTLGRWVEKRLLDKDRPTVGAVLAALDGRRGDKVTRRQGDKAGRRGEFAPLVGRARKMRVPESGVW